MGKQTVTGLWHPAREREHVPEGRGDPFTQHLTGRSKVGGLVVGAPEAGIAFLLFSGVGLHTWKEEMQAWAEVK
jgi:hypothetical protein